MQLIIICKYCNHTIEKSYYAKEYAKSDKCNKCGDKNLIIRDASTKKIDTYKGCPDFEVEVVEEDKDDYNDYHF